MTNVNFSFNYKGSKILIQRNLEDKVKEICQKFLIKINQDIESKIYIYEGKLLDLDLPFNKQCNLKNIFNEEITILVYDKPENDKIHIRYNYEGENKEVLLNMNDNILKRVSSLIKRPYEKLNILFNGGNASKEDFNKNFNELANEQNREDKSLSLLIFDRAKTIKDDQIKDEIIELKDIKEDNEKVNDEESVNNKIESNEKVENTKYVKELKKFHIKISSISLIQYILINFSVWIGFKYEINKIIINRYSIYFIIIPSLLYAYIVLIIMLCFGGKDRNYSKGLFINISLVLFIPINSLNCLLLSKYIEAKYIITVLNLVVIDYLNLEIHCIIFEKFKGIFFFLFSLLIKLISLTIFYFYFFHNNNKAIIYLSIISFYMIIFIISCFNDIEKNETDDEYLVCTMEFAYTNFWPILVFLSLLILIFIVSLILAVLIIIVPAVFLFALIAEFIVGLFN